MVAPSRISNRNGSMVMENREIGKGTEGRAVAGDSVLFICPVAYYTPCFCVYISFVIVITLFITMLTIFPSHLAIPFIFLHVQKYLKKKKNM